MRRLDILFGPGGWTQSFSMTTVSNIQRSKKVNKAYAMITTGKILVTSTITIEGFGTRSSTGEGWADDENGTTRAQAQAFRRACAEFGLGRYLRELEGWSCKVPVNAKGYFKRPHFSVLPDSAIHPSELAEARKYAPGLRNHPASPAAPRAGPLQSGVVLSRLERRRHRRSCHDWHSCVRLLDECQRHTGGCTSRHSSQCCEPLR